MATKDYYAVLGISSEATDAEIKRAFRRKARETHPDVADHDGAEDAFKELNEAYEVLSDPEKRRMYDRYGTADPRAAAPDMGDFFGGIGVDDIFSAFFGGGFGAQARPRTTGRDMTAVATITLEEAASGVTKTLKVTRDAPCPDCGGTGSTDGSGAKTCPDCSGTGQRRTGRRTFLGVVETAVPCQTCSATGSVVEAPCAKCGGEGRRRLTEEVEVEIPSGVGDGMGIRVPGRGEAGVRGATSGDLIVTVRVAPHEFLHREGDDLHVRASLTISQAALGADLKVPGLDGDVDLAVPAGTQFGDVVRVRGEGMPRLRGNGRGELVVHLAVDVPKKLNKRQRELLAELGESFGDAGRTTPLERLRDWLTG